MPVSHWGSLLWPRSHEVVNSQWDRGTRSMSSRGGYPGVLRACWVVLCMHPGEGTLGRSVCFGRRRVLCS
eukprot:3686185-Pyramimonas_sp.AAC.1